MIHAAATVLATSPLAGASLRTTMSRFFERALSLRGRASRSEYWWWMLVNIVTMTMLQLVIPTLLNGRAPEGTIVVGPFGSLDFSSVSVATWSGAEVVNPAAVTILSIIAAGWLLLTAIPGVTVAVRRLHDSNLSGWWALLGVIPFGALVVLALATRQSRAEAVRFD
ncbi:MAG: DUF805 domain-containing protein [Rhodoglobus sp.]